MSNSRSCSKPASTARGDRFRALIAAGGSLISLVAPLQAMTPMDYLSSQTRPAFRQGHTLLPLARCGWPNTTFGASKELADYWGYSLPLSGWMGSNDTANHARPTLSDPTANDNMLIQLAASDPQKYKLHMYIDRTLPSYQECPQCYCHAADGTPVSGGSVWSPEAPDSVLRRYAKMRAASFSMIKTQAPVFLASNMGEYGLSVPGNNSGWALDPVVNARAAGNWWGYISERKAHQELLLDSLVKATLAPGGNYYYYSNGGNTGRNRYGGWGDWCWMIESMKDISPYSSEESYYKNFNSGFTGPTTSQGANILTSRLNAKGWEIALGKPLSYDWVCAGWGQRGGNDQGFGNTKTWMGFLKCSYTVGMIGANVGFYQFIRDDAPFDSTVDSLSHWIYQVMAQGRAQALFSWIEPFLRNGDLLPGPAMNPWSTTNPAYEFPVANDDSAHVLARKLTGRDRWIITAWAAGGSSRMVQATIPTLGTVSVRARNAGTVYHATLNGTAPVLTMLDKDSMCVTFDTTILRSELGDLYGTTAAARSSVPGFAARRNSRQAVVDIRGRVVGRHFERSELRSRYNQQGAGVRFVLGRDAGGRKTVVPFVLQ